MASRPRVAGGKSAVDSIYGVLGILLPVVGVEAGVHNVVIIEGAQAVAVAREVRRAGIGRALSDDTHESVVESPHLGLDGAVAKSGEIWVRPGVRTDLVALVDHTLNERSLRPISDGSTPVLAVDEESSLDTTRRKIVQKVGGEVVWAVIESESELARNSAAVDPLAVRNWAGLGGSGASSSSSTTTTRASSEGGLASGSAVLSSITTPTPLRTALGPTSRASVSIASPSVSSSATQSVIETHPLLLPLFLLPQVPSGEMARLARASGEPSLMLGMAEARAVAARAS